ncbi:MAG: protease modulator HflK [Phycisphaerae bacterium]|nr:protease modulator HflK [Phycisphaerae bacterium]
MAHTHEHHSPGQSPDELQAARIDELDPAGQSLTNALRHSFVILKIIMVLLVVLFLFSGVFRVQQNEEALVLQFGKFRGEGESRILRPGLKFAFPEPISEVIRISVKHIQSLAIDSFWYFETEQERLGQAPRRDVTGPLNPLQDGYNLTRNDQQTGQAGADYNIVHSRWVVTYYVRSPVDFFETVYVRPRQPGEDFLDAAAETVEPLLNSLASNAIVSTLVKYSIDDAVRSRTDIAVDVKNTLQRKLDDIGSGLEIDAVRADRIVWPRQVDEAFQASNRARQERSQMETEARSYQERLLTETGGPGAERVLRTLRDANLTQEQQAEEVAKLTGQAQTLIAEARAYRTRVVEEAKANAEYLENLLPEYRKRPELVLQKIYQDAIEEVLAGAEEKILIQPATGGQSREVRVLINRDPQIRRPQPDQQDGSGR